jgi:hypothetical protein
MITNFSNSSECRGYDIRNGVVDYWCGRTSDGLFSHPTP